MENKTLKQQMIESLFGDSGSVTVAQLKKILIQIVEHLLKFEKKIQEKDMAFLQKTQDDSSRILTQLKYAVDSMLQAKDGKDGKHGKDGKDGEKGIPGKPGKDAKDIPPETGVTIIEKINRDTTKKILGSKIQGWEELMNIATTANVNARYGSFGEMRVEGEIVSGSGTSWTLDFVPAPTTSLALYFRGQRRPLTGNYTLSSKTITTTDSWDTGDLIADYRY